MQYGGIKDSATPGRGEYAVGVTEPRLVVIGYWRCRR